MKDLKKELTAAFLLGLSEALIVLLIWASLRITPPWHIPLSILSAAIGCRIWEMARNRAAHRLIKRITITDQELAENPQLAAALYILHHHLHHVRQKNPHSN